MHILLSVAICPIRLERNLHMFAHTKNLLKLAYDLDAIPCQSEAIRAPLQESTKIGALVM
jgi:hypothetical protein